MKIATLAVALLMSGAAFAQTSDHDAHSDASVDSTVTSSSDPAAADTSVEADASVTSAPAPTELAQAPAGDAIVQPGNNAPELDARGIAVISAPAMVPPGFNGVTATAVGGPLLDPATGEPVADAEGSYPPCTADVTDNCLQTYERGRAS
jgi:hypothetical protein